MMDKHEGRGLTEFLDDRLECRRLFSELWGTFLLVLVAAGAGAVGAQPYGGGLILAVKVIAPGVTVMAIIYLMGTVSGAHLNPAVTWAFALRGNFPWRRVPGYLVAQAIGAFLACLFLQCTIGGIRHGATVPGPGVSDWVAVAIEGVLTLGLVSVILGTSSGARNIGPNAAIAIGGVHRNRRRVGCAGHRCVDESDALACAGRRRGAAEHVLDLSGRTNDRRDHRGRV
jgi:aquaporin Z